MSPNPKKAVIQESGKCIGWVCMACVRLHTTAIYLAKDEEAEAAALDAATRCCVTPLCACGAEAKVYAKQCPKCWRAEQDAKDEARWDAAPKKTIAEYLAEHPDGFVSDGGDHFWPVSDYVDDEVYLRHPRVWFCEPQRGIKLDADDITESWADDRHEDARDDLDLKGLQELLDKWCAEQVTTSWYVTGVALAPSEVEHLCREAAERDKRRGVAVTAIGKVIELDASGLYDERHARAGFVTVIITCTHEQALAWGQLWGRDVQALPFIPPAGETKTK